MYILELTMFEVLSENQWKSWRQDTWTSYYWSNHLLKNVPLSTVIYSIWYWDIIVGSEGNGLVLIYVILKDRIP